MQTIQLEIDFSAYQISDDEIRNAIGESRIAEIKKQDPKPSFVAYIIAQEGKSTPKVLSNESKPIVWMREKMKSLSSAIQAGTKLFWNHNKDNSTEDRKVFGTVEATFERIINGKNSVIAVAYVPQSKEKQVREMDVISMEAVISLIDQGSQYLADAVKSVTGLAIGKSSDWEPAFSGAKQISMIQAMSVEPQKDEPKKMITFDEVKKFVEERKVFPSQLYAPEQIFGKAVNDTKGKIRFVGGDALLVEKAEEWVASHVTAKTEELLGKTEQLEKTISELSNTKKEYFNKAVRQEWFPQLKEKAVEQKFTEKALKLLDLELQEIDIPEDEKAREELGTKILDKVSDKHKALFGDESGQDKIPVTTESKEENPFLI